MQRLSQRRLQRASGWFEQMRRAVDNAEACADLGPDRATNAEEPATNQLHEEVFFGSMGV
jgi:hypothetical protein